jgi:FKBP-type peptidyl-prolyl cis-trans isomerase
MLLFLWALQTVVAKSVSLTPDGRVMKTLIREGDGPSPRADQGVVIHYSGFLEDGTLFDSSRSRSELTFTLGRGVIAGWSLGVRSMKVGEISNFSIHYSYGYGEHGYPPVIPARAHLSFEIELLGLE